MLKWQKISSLYYAFKYYAALLTLLLKTDLHSVQAVATGMMHEVVFRLFLSYNMLPNAVLDVP